MKLNDTRIRSAKPGAVNYRIADGLGLSLLIKPSGSKLWHFRYRHNGKANNLSLGRYPDTSLKLARDKRDAARKLLAAGIDPSEERQREKAERRSTFRDIAEEWFAKQRHNLADATVVKIRWQFDTHIYPELGNEPVKAITPLMVLRALRRIEAKGLHETAHNARRRISAVLRYAVATGHEARDVTHDLPRDILTPVKVQHRPAITSPDAFGTLLQALDNYAGQPVTKAALQLLALTFARPGELRQALWSEFDLRNAQWVIPGPRMKMRREHIVPLSKQAVALLEELHKLTGHRRGELVFPSLRPGRPLSENTLNMALRSIGYDTQTQHCAHGFRSSASSLLHELGKPSQVIELCLAHSDTNQVRAIYNRSERLAERRELMQAWADYIDGLKAGNAEERKQA
jgi:integrase